MLCAGLLFSGGCGGNGDGDNGTVTEIYNGTMYVDLTPGFVGGDGTDSIRFTVRSGTFAFEHLTRTTDPPLCDSEGEITGFGTNRARLDPTNWFGSNCSQRTPNGEFVTVFNGDSLSMTNIDQSTTVFDIDLVLTLRRSSAEIGNPVQ